MFIGVLREREVWVSNPHKSFSILNLALHVFENMHKSSPNEWSHFQVGNPNLKLRLILNLKIFYTLNSGTNKTIVSTNLKKKCLQTKQKHAQMRQKRSQRKQKVYKRSSNEGLYFKVKNRITSWNLFSDSKIILWIIAQTKSLD